MPLETPPAVSPQPPGVADVILPRAEATPEPAAPATGAEQIAEEARKKMAQREGFWNRVSPPKEAAKPKGETPPAEPAAATPEPEKKPKKGKAEAQLPEAPEPPAEAEKPKRRKQAPDVDPAEIAEQTGRAIGDQIAKSLSKPAAPATPEPEAPELPEEFRRDTAVFEEMARQDPKRYGNIKKDLTKYAASEDQYIEKWEADHPGEAFDGDAPEHNEFYERIKVNYDQADFETAKTTLIENRATERATKAAREEFKKEYETREQQREQAAKIQPELEREMFGLVGEMAKEIDPSQDVKDMEAIRSIEKNNRLLHAVLSNVHNETKPVLEASMRLFRSIDKFDPTNPAHNAFSKLVGEAEQQVLALPIRERYHEGRLFARQTDYVQMTAAEQEKHWYVGENELAAYLRGRAIARTKAIYERESERLAYFSNGGAATAKPNQPAKTEGDTTPPPKPEPKPDTASPSVSGRGSLPGDGQPAAKTPTDGKGWFWNKYLPA